LVGEERRDFQYSQTREDQKDYAAWSEVLEEAGVFVIGLGSGLISHAVRTDPRSKE
jgi:hypothetical protein